MLANTQLSYARSSYSLNLTQIDQRIIFRGMKNAQPKFHAEMSLFIKMIPPNINAVKKVYLLPNIRDFPNYLVSNKNPISKCSFAMIGIYRKYNKATDEKKAHSRK